MLELRRNNRVVMQTDDDLVMEMFEAMVTVWNDETSGWDRIGAFWSVREVPAIIVIDNEDDGTDPDRPVPDFLGGLLS